MTGPAIELTAPSPVPGHVPARLVFDFDFVADPLVTPDPHVGMALLHERAPPLFWTPRHGGHWICRDYELAFAISKDPALFSSRFTGRIPRTETEIDMFPISIDPPEHTVYRAALAPFFGPRAIAELAGSIRQLAVALADRVAGQGGCEFIAAVAEPLPITIVLKLLGLPVERADEYRRLALRSIKAGSEAEYAAAFADIAAVIARFVADTREGTGSDIISRLWRSGLGGREATVEELESILLLLFVGGLDTVVNALGFGIRHLARDKPLQARLRADPSLIPAAVEELLRLYGIAQTCRMPTRDVEFNGVSLRKGEQILILVSAANLDPKAFPDPLGVDLDRERAHMTFSTGIHRCIGSHLARLEIATLYEEWLARIPEFSLDPDHPPHVHAGRIQGIDSLHIVWNTENEAA